MEHKCSLHNWYGQLLAYAIDILIVLFLQQPVAEMFNSEQNW